MLRKNRKIALIFDFDETLVDDSTTQLLQRNGIDPDEFWNEKHAALIQKSWDPTEAYLMLLVKEMKDRRKLGELTAHNLREFGATLQLFEGVRDMFAELRKLVPDNVTILFFIISGSLQEVIAGTPIAKELYDHWGSTLDDGSALGVPYPKNVVSFTEKTRYIFQINKGLIGAQYRNKPYEVNEFMDPRARAVPLENMIYVGDGLTDVPCFSILENKGVPIVVYNQYQGKREGIQRAVKLARHRFLGGPYKANYRKGSSLRNLIDEICRQRAEAT